ncbi:PREDICTED: uncharacterized protein LOC108563669 [Nicrophorus vespilloides]|uniref:Uncharacterized protein LOC108563669 n=1 Tax=Nicrophorus vespilloides TaxID=110193 RepID=A0ABM1MTJ6_NICVS|nr:PREDICTED: uncharacterized protein LOC108563669 [Nicrophorus vespilloides]
MKVFAFLFIVAVTVYPSCLAKNDVETYYLKDKIKAAFECVRGIMKEGIPSVGLPSLDQLNVDELNVDLNKLGIENVAGSLNVSALELKGLSGFFLSNMDDKVSVLPPSYELIMHFNEPELLLETEYEIEAEIYGISVTGTGRASIKVTDLVLDIGFKGELVARKPYLHYAHIYPTIETFNASITGLFDDEELSKTLSGIISDTVLATVNDNSQAIGDQIGDYIKQIINNVYSALPLDIGDIIEAIVDKCS